MPCFEGSGGHWNPLQVRDMPDDVADRLLGLHQSPFSKYVEPTAESKAFHAPEDKMMKGAPANKAANEFEQVFVGGEIKDDKEPGKPIIEEKPAEPEADPQPIQLKDESNNQFKKRLKAWKDKQAK